MILSYSIEFAIISCSMLTVRLFKKEIQHGVKVKII